MESRSLPVAGPRCRTSIAHGNGVVAVPVMITMMHMTANPKVMGKFPVHDGLRLIGWMATAVMAAAAIAMGVTAVL